MQPNPVEINKVIGTLLSLATKDSVKHVLQTFEPTSTLTSNISKLSSNDVIRDQLQDTVEFLENEFPHHKRDLTISQSKRNKKGYAELIVNCIQKVVPIDCLRCNSPYEPYNQSPDSSTVNCFLCERPAHTACYNSLEIDPKIGLVFVCQICLTTPKPKPENATPLAQKEQTNPTSDPGSQTSTQPPVNDQPTLPVTVPDTQHPPPSTLPGNQDTPPPIPNPNPPKNPNKDESNFCKLLLEHKCPHGISGKNCPNFHPKWCYNYQKYGPEACRYGKRCNFYHPRICNNSLELKVCLNPDCKEMHLPQTRRKPLRPDKPEKPTPKNPVPVKNPVPKPVNPKPISKPLLPNPPEPRPPLMHHHQPLASSIEEKTSPFLPKNEFFQYLEKLKTDLQTSVVNQVKVALQSFTPPAPAPTSTQVLPPVDTDYQPPLLMQQPAPEMTSQQALQVPNLPQSQIISQPQMFPQYQLPTQNFHPNFYPVPYPATTY